MIGLGELSPFGDVQAVIKGKIGEFLAAETPIRQMQQNSSASIRADAAGLLAAHKVLEADLGDAQTKITNFQNGSWSISDVISLGDVGTRLIQHINNVKRLQDQAQGVATPLFGMPTGVMPALVIAAAVGVGFLFMRK